MNDIIDFHFTRDYSKNYIKEIKIKYDPYWSNSESL